ncbi:hypothetical protein ACQP10_37995 (plasmid) [Streptosporangium sandarakinum]|uniref:hypothetical protein n=1 Tax=Streptosporangium sandarakinum TaxID=1260955 RepID=UPI003D942E40
MSATVRPEQVAMRAGLPLELDADDRAVIEEAIEDAYGDVAAHLDYSPVPATFTERGLRPNPGGAWQLQHDPVIEVVSATAEADPVSGQPTGLFTVVYRAGLDPVADPVYGRALKRYVLAAAAASPMVRRLAQRVPGARLVASVNVEGQGVTYESSGAGAPGSGAAGAPPTLESLDGWQRRAVSQRPGIGPHPMQTGAAWLL